MPTIPESVHRLILAGIAPADARALRRIAMTLHRWFEAECNGTVEREGENADGHPYCPSTGRRLPDRERGANARLFKIMSRYPGWHAYVQPDPRGAALWIMPPGSVPPDTTFLRECYTRGIAVYR